MASTWRQDERFTGAIMAISRRVSTKVQTVLPLAVREHLRIRPGDEIEYDLQEGYAILRPKRRAALADEPFALFTEWAGPADEEDYADL
ncbi:transcriptional regulator, SpoVT [Rhodospirillum centenum SW]|uniref:Transcriptional regulator, SpoVT n=2 Tax=Rhodospirillum centenum TaxID=34018 RepID=B6IUP8_RHOCS|nr:transcriptional regulator, SpoVT [Rhodospirillum centenum SW]